MKIVVDSRVRLRDLDPASEALAAEVRALRERFCHDNPVYWEARRFRRPCRHLARLIDLASDGEGGGVDLPRGGLDEIERRLRPFATAATEDATAFPEAPRREFLAGVRDYQEVAIRAALERRQGVIRAPTGSGKTVIALALASRLATPALIVVHTSVLLEQTTAKIRQFLGVEPGRIGGGEDRVGDVTVAMVQTLMRRDLAPLRDRFGLVVLDEAHHCPAETFKSVVQAFAARYRIGLTATPTRKDRLHPVLFDVVGPIIADIDAGELVASGSIARTEVVEVATEFKAFYRNDYQALLSRLVHDRKRNDLVVASVRDLHRERSLVLTERVDHAHVLGDALAGDDGARAAVLTGEMAREDRERVLAQFTSGEVAVLVATTALVGEGFDLPAIDTVFLTVPNGNVAKTTQALGRALRPAEGKVAGRIVDFVDGNVPLLRSQYRRRAKVYRSFAEPARPRAAPGPRNV